MSLDSYVHAFIPAPKSVSGIPPLLLLPRTSGTETTLIDLAKRLSPNAPLLSLRGNVLEDNHSRFFRRVARGQFDLDDFRVRTLQLRDFIAAARREYDISAPVAVGHSNGANIAWSLVLADPSSLAGAVLFRPLMPLDPGWPPQTASIPVLIVAGADDTVAPLAEAKALPAKLEKAGSHVTFEVLPAAHDMTADDESVARRWLATTFSP